VFSGSERYLEVNVDGEFLAPRKPLSAVAYAMKAETVSEGAVGQDQLAADAVTSDKIVDGTIGSDDISNNSLTGADILNESLTSSDISDGSITSGDIKNESLTGDDIQDGSITANDVKDVFVMNTGDTVGGPLRINGGIGIDTEPTSGYGIIIDSSSAPSIGAWLNGSDTGIYAFWSDDPFEHYAQLATEQYGIRVRSGNSDETGNRFGGYFETYGQEEVYGLRSIANGNSTDSTFGIASTSYNSGPGTSYGGYFMTGSGGTGEHYGALGTAYSNSSANTYGLYGRGSNSSTGKTYGVYGTSNNYGVYGAWADDPDDHYAYLGSPNYGVYAKSGNSDETTEVYGGMFNARSQGEVYGVYGYANGQGSSPGYGVYGETNHNGSGNGYGGYFYTSDAGTGDHYGVRASAYGNSSTETTYGVYGMGFNSSSADAYGGYFFTTSSGSGDHYGVYGVHSGLTADNYGYLGGSTYGVYGMSGSSVLERDMTGGFFEAKSDDKAVGIEAIAYSYGSSGDQAIGGVFRGYQEGTGSTATGISVYASGGFSGGNMAIKAYVPGANDYALYATTGNKAWVNPDPEDPTKSIAYVTLEGGISGTYHAGRARLENGQIVVVLPDHFRKVTSPDENVMVTVTPRGQCNGLMVTQSDNVQFTIEELSSGTSSVEFDFVVMGYRLGYEDYEPIRENLDYVPFEGHLNNMDANEMTSQEFYDEMGESIKDILKKNGTLDENGKINQTTFTQKGWNVVSEKIE
jgi:hypothetical protein